MLINVMACDPSLNNFGFVEATIDTDTMEIKPQSLRLNTTASSNKKRVRKNSDDLERCQSHAEVWKEIEQGKTVAFVEVPVGSQSARAMASYGMCIGLLAGSNIPLIQLTPYEVKLAAVGSKTASKKEMIEWAYSMYPDLDWIKHGAARNVGNLTDANEHLADAIATLHAGIKHEDFRSVLSILKMQEKLSA